MVATASTCVFAVSHEFFSRQARLKSGLVQKLRVADDFFPVVRWMDVHFNHPWVGRDLQHFEAWIFRWWIAFQHDLESQFNRSFFHSM